MNVIIDGNLEIFKALHVVSDFGKRQLMESRSDEISFVQKVIYDIFAIYNTFSFIDRVVVVFDSKNSWRKDIEIEENDGYKSNRQKTQQDVNWNKIFHVVDELIVILRMRGIPVLQIPRAEGDDLLYLLSDYFIKHDQNSILVTTDKDIHQCVYHDNDVFSIVYGGLPQDRKIYAENGFKSWLEQERKVNLFDSSTFSGNTTQDILLSTIQRQSISVIEFDPTEMIFCKILAGDRGDSVPPVLKWLNKTDPSKKWGATERKAQQVWANMGCVKPLDMLYNDSLRIEIANQLIHVCRCVGEGNPEDVANKIERNTRLVCLSKSIIPSEIIDQFDIEILDLLKMPKQNIVMEYFVEGTRFETKQSTDSVIDVLKYY